MRPVTRGWARSRADPDPVECGPLSVAQDATLPF